MTEKDADHGTRAEMHESRHLGEGPDIDGAIVSTGESYRAFAIVQPGKTKPIPHTDSAFGLTNGPLRHLRSPLVTGMPTVCTFFKRTLAEGNLVVLHCHQRWPTDPNPDWAGIDIFRFDDQGKFVEHWDVLQAVPSEAKHGNSMF